MTLSSDQSWMQIALQEAEKAYAEDEVPVGAIIVRDHEVLATDHNRSGQKQDPLAHAEKLVIEKLISQGYKFLQDCTLFVTIEPCLMCAGMIIWSRIGRVVFGASDPKAGAAGSVYNVLLDNQLNHNPDLTSGVLAEECSSLMKKFFRKKRSK